MDQKKKVAVSAGSPTMPKKPGDRSRVSPKPPPNYMKPIRNHRARKDVLEASTHKPCSCETKQNSNSSLVASGQSKMRKPTMKPSKEKDGHTCSSAFKDVTFRVEPDAGHEHASTKVCKYSRCSLNAHGHEPHAKHPFLVRRLSVKAQNSFSVKGVPASSSSAASSSSRRRGVWQVEKPDIDRHAPCWVDSISAMSTSQRNNLQSGIEGGDGAEEIEDHDTNSYVSTTSEFSAAELDIVRNFLETAGSDCVVASDEDKFYATVTVSTEWCLDRSNLEELDEMINIFPEEETRLSIPGEKAVQWNEENTRFREDGEEDHPFENRKIGTEIYLTIEREAVQMGVLNFDDTEEILGSSNKDPGEDPSAELGTSGELDGICEHTRGSPSPHAPVARVGHEHDASVEDPNEAGLEVESIINEAEEYLEVDLESHEEEDYPSVEFECQLEKEYAPADIQLLLEEYLLDGSEIADEDGAASNTEEDHEKPPESEGKLEARLSMKKSLIKKCFEKLKTIRQFREPGHLPTVRERDLRRTELRQMVTHDERIAEEWMVDYKLRRLVAELARARKQKVELLVEAFESITPKSVKACY